MESPHYPSCERQIKISVDENKQIEPNQIKGHMWCAINTDKNVKPEMFGPLRYKINVGMHVYKQVVEPILSDSNKKYASELMENELDFMVFVNGEYQCITLL